MSSVHLSARLLKKLRTDFDEIFWRCGAWPKEQSDFGGHPDHVPDPDIF